MSTTAPDPGQFRVGVDVGGTFTDFIGTDGSSTWVTKVASTPDEPSRAVVEGLARLCGLAGISVGEVSVLLHGTTLATNAVLQRSGATTALITTRGFRDILSIARQIRPRLFDLNPDRAEPLIPRSLRFEVSERIEASGTVSTPIALDELDDTIAELRQRGVESVAICFLHAYLNPSHEQAARAYIEKRWPEIRISISSDVLLEYREYERSSTTAINAYVAPRMERYLSAMGTDLKRSGANCSVRVMQSNGGLMTIERASRLPAATVLSGVAAGALGGVKLAHAAGRGEVLTLDMGGTSCDLAVGTAGDVLNHRSYEIGGLPIRLPALDVRTIGAGGGSIAYLDAGGGVHVGPRSAGAVPGPACYDQGGQDPTVTDANLVLGRIPEALLGGEVPLERTLAIESITRAIAQPLGLEIEAAAAGIIRVINAAMAREMRVITVQRGIDPRECTLVAFGGGGPVHAVELARELEMGEVIVPPSPGVTSAVGLLLADTRYDRVKTVLVELTSQEARNSAANLLTTVFAALAADIEREVAQDGATTKLRHVREVEMRYLRQGHEIRVSIPEEALDIETLETAFHAAHRERFGYSMEGDPVLVVNALLAAVIDDDRRDIGDGSQVEDDRTTVRSVWFDDTWIDTPVRTRSSLRIGETGNGPLIVEQTDTTTVIPPQSSFAIDDRGNLVISVGTGS